MNASTSLRHASESPHSAAITKSRSCNAVSACCASGPPLSAPFSPFRLELPVGDLSRCELGSRVVGQEVELSTAPTGFDELVGRTKECLALDRLLSDALAGASGVLVLRGDVGTGKSALIRHVCARAGAWRVTSVVGVESEMELAFSGIHQLCSPLLSFLDRLPEPQRVALETVFGLESGPPPDRFLVALSALALLAEAAEDQPLVCIVDDAHWLDAASAQVVGFVARRLLVERIVIVCATRSGIGDDALAGLPQLAVSGLSKSDSRALLLAHMAGPLDAAVCEQIVAESHGNPLALLELPRTWRVDEIAGGFGLPGQPVTGKIEQSYSRRLLELPA